MKLIDSDELKRQLKKLPMMSNWGEAFIPRLIDEQPTISAVPVVRCRECENYDENGDCISLDLRIGIHSDRKPAAQAPCFSYGVSGDIAAFH